MCVCVCVCVRACERALECGHACVGFPAFLWLLHRPTCVSVCCLLLTVENKLDFPEMHIHLKRLQLQGF